METNKNGVKGRYVYPVDGEPYFLADSSEPSIGRRQGGNGRTKKFSKKMKAKKRRS